MGLGHRVQETVVAANLEFSSRTALRFRLLKHTRLNVVAFLNELPKTQHDVNSFVVDISAQTVSTCFCCYRSLNWVKGQVQGMGTSGSGWSLCADQRLFSFRVRCCVFLSTGSSKKVRIFGVWGVQSGPSRS